MARDSRVGRDARMLLPWLLVALVFPGSEADAAINYAKKLRDDLFANKHVIEAHIRPGRMEESVVVQTQLILKHILDFDTKNETLTAHIILKMSWEDNRLSWDTKEYGGIKEIHVTKKMIWTPDILNYNGDQDNSNIYENSLLSVFASGKVVWLNPLTLLTPCPVDLRRFPFDEHQCVIRLGSWTQHAYLISLTLKSTKVLIEEDTYDNNEINDPGGDRVRHLPVLLNEHNLWSITNATAQVEHIVYKCCPEPYHSVAMYLTLKRRSPQFLITFVLPVCTTMLVMLAVFLFPPTSGEKITTGCFAVLYLLLLDIYSFWTIPNNGSGVPNIVLLIGISLILAALSVMVSVILVSLSSFSHHRGVPLLASTLGKITCLDLQNNQGAFDTASSSMVEDLSQTISEKRHEWVILAKAIDRIFLGSYVIIIIILLASLLS